MHALGEGGQKVVNSSCGEVVVSLLRVVVAPSVRSSGQRRFNGCSAVQCSTGTGCCAKLMTLNASPRLQAALYCNFSIAKHPNINYHIKQNLLKTILKIPLTLTAVSSAAAAAAILTLGLFAGAKAVRRTGNDHPQFETGAK